MSKLTLVLTSIEFSICLYILVFSKFSRNMVLIFVFFFFYYNNSLFVRRIRFKKNLKNNVILFAWIFWKVQQCVYIKTNKWSSKNNDERIYSWTMVTRQKRTVTMFPNAKFMFLVIPLTFSEVSDQLERKFNSLIFRFPDISCSTNY